MSDNKIDILAEVPDLLKERLIDLKDKIDNVEQIAKKIESKPLKDVESELSALELAKFNWISIYAINSLFFVYLKNNGVNLKEHPIMSELLRIKNYFSRINEIVQSEELKNTKNSQKIDKESSARIIKRSLWMNASKIKKEVVSELVNTTIENTIKRENDAEHDSPSKRTKTE